MFGDDLRPLFAQLVQDEKLSADDLAYLRELVAEAERSKK